MWTLEKDIDLSEAAALQVTLRSDVKGMQEGRVHDVEISRISMHL
jgi:hypothetical protein